ncbi:MAG TPA: protein phosphatase 2C domain-containing protein [Thermoanaerobaculia bacterium]|nr:protein phosphatase 2C domain-containing protein [Thermoanaerobaculia bacterium]
MRSSGPIAAAGTDPGRERENNEDRVLSDPERGIFAVVDGVGGESGGEVAAQTAVDVLKSRLSRRTTDTDRLIREAIALANKQILEKAQAQPELAGMACVLTVAVLDGAKATIGHVGDSRLYLLQRGGIRKVTRDHSPVGMREDAGELSETEAMFHPRRNEIFRDVGSAPHEPDEDGFVDVYSIPFDAESALLLCSDGLSDLVPSAAMREIVEARPGQPERAVRELIDAANAAGGKDNISVVLVEGERFGKGSDPLDSTHATTRLTPRPQLRGAAVASPTTGEKVRASTWRVFLLTALAVLILLGVAAWFFREPILEQLVRLGLRMPEAPAAVLRVDPRDPEGFRTIAEALQAAQPGQTVEVAPGEYLGPIELTSGVSLVSRTPRTVILRLPQGTAEPAITAEGVSDARLAGFKIEGNAQGPLEIGLRLASSKIVVENVEISGAATAGIEIAGTDGSEIRESFVHDNPGTGVIVRDQAAPRLHGNYVYRNGAGPGPSSERLRPGIEIRDMARPQIVQNRIEENATAGIWVPAADRVDEIFGFNTFGKLPKEKAVTTPPKPGPSPPDPLSRPLPARRERGNTRQSRHARSFLEISPSPGGREGVGEGTGG